MPQSTDKTAKEEKKTNPAPVNQPKVGSEDGQVCDDPTADAEHDKKPHCPTGYPDQPQANEKPSK